MLLMMDRGGKPVGTGTNQEPACFFPVLDNQRQNNLMAEGNDFPGITAGRLIHGQQS